MVASSIYAESLLLLPVLVALFFALSHATETYGTAHVKQWLVENRNGGGVVFKGPLLFSQGMSSMGQNNTVETTEKFYLWLLGPVYELSWELKHVDKIDENNSVNDIMTRRLFGK